ncbi:MAG: bifunctional demethylmenaquinone methyltransferase/2-methoxy-6-polyprenyl-1,4-benzoquinol methylase [Micavibrio sp. TMED27]|nr:bifunctional demethylmenaquinone methyltransferase/2-methoxy-6-polyprenyl-1,4-benzoquinol methylase UbiE [Micavibrio sp.]OUT89894.1 MAG: bifunctional demethylmenaquinone methyltransferase/2-methoxy-6-polyprenyl-1,4-benzoquinol methylase [Micavibrio sp. TMED27]|tara:strand:+ start:1019 stop:1792 length:774 start_codon:yes stop_codon:yes gene_type:complete
MTQTQKKNPESTQFGTKTVSPEEKTTLVRGVFDSVAEKYDIMNDVMSGGLHRLWKDHLVRSIGARPRMKCLDVAGGTGDIAFRLRKNGGPSIDITVFDLNHNMLSVGRDRAINKGWVNDFEWITGNAETLPFPDNHFDLYTIAFGLRNVTRIDTAIAEAYRVLKPGGRFFCLEFSHVRNPVLSKAYDFYSFSALPKMGELIAQDRESYQYLAESIRKFPTQADLKARMEATGFEQCKFSNLSGGICAIHQGTKSKYS